MLQSQKHEMIEQLTKTFIQSIQLMMSPLDGRLCNFLLVLLSKVFNSENEMNETDLRDILAVVVVSFANEFILNKLKIILRN